MNEIIKNQPHVDFYAEQKSQAFNFVSIYRLVLVLFSSTARIHVRMRYVVQTTHTSCAKDIFLQNRQRLTRTGLSCVNSKK